MGQEPPAPRVMLRVAIRDMLGLVREGWKGGCCGGVVRFGKDC
jgi:hypothetical protein